MRYRPEVRRLICKARQQTLKKPLFIDFGMLPFSPAIYNDEEDENLAVTMVSYGDDTEVSLFGHSANTDAYWQDLTGTQDAKNSRHIQHIHSPDSSYST